MAYEDKRAYNRIPFAGLVMFRNPPMEGTGIDVGSGGVAVRVADPISEGSAVEVDLLGTGDPVTGIVRRSTPDPAGGFRLGIKWHVENGLLVSRMRDQTA
ncbi:MAG: PilZ domain-containing protein [SAR324 cluster bacterium]